jgi:hypothetical protein
MPAAMRAALMFDLAALALKIGSIAGRIQNSCERSADSASTASG